MFSRFSKMADIPPLKPRAPKKDLPKLKSKPKTEKKLLPKLKPNKNRPGRV